MVRQICAMALIAVLALSLCKPQMIMAQVPPQGNQNSGTFGNHTLGQPLVPTPSTFGGGIQTAPGGSFLGRSDGSPALATPRQQNNTGVPVPSAAAQPAPSAAALPQSRAADQNPPELQAVPGSAPPSVSETNRPPAASRSNPTPARRSCPTA